MSIVMTGFKSDILLLDKRIALMASSGFSFFVLPPAVAFNLAFSISCSAFVTSINFYDNKI